MRCLITGANGLVGSNLSKRLEKESIFDSIRLGYHSKSKPSYDNRFTNYIGDLRDRNFCDYITKDVEVVFHCAASTSGAAAIQSTPLAHVTPNVVMNAELMEASYNNKVQQFVWLASTTGYPYLPGVPMEESQMFDGDPYDKYFAVGWTKRFTEKLCELYATKLNPRMNCIVLRPTNIYGPGDKFDFATCHVLPAMIRKFAEKQNPLEVWGDGTDTRDFIYVDDMVEAIIKACSLSDFEQINVGSGTQFSIHDVINSLSYISGHFPDIDFLLDKPRMIPSRDVNIDKAKRLLGDFVKTDLDRGLYLTLDWYTKTYHVEQYK